MKYVLVLERKQELLNEIAILRSAEMAGLLAVFFIPWFFGFVVVAGIFFLDLGIRSRDRELSDLDNIID